MSDGVVRRQRRIAAGERVEGRRVGVAGDRGRFLVLEHHDDDVRERRHAHRRRRNFRDGRAHRAAPAAGCGDRKRAGEREPSA
jgi:hypothetical protein